MEPMQRKRPLERFLSRLLVVSMFVAQLPLTTLARADDATDALQDLSAFDNSGAVVLKSPVPLPKSRPAGAGPSAAQLDAASKKNKDGWGAADPIVNAARAKENAAKIGNKQVSDIGICDAADAATNKKAGIAASIATWPAKDTSKWDASAKQFAADQRRQSLDNPAVSSKHSAFSGQIEGRVDLSGAIASREEFFQYVFGGKDKKPGWFVESICEGRRQIAEKMKSYANALAKGPNDNAAGCHSYESIRDLNGTVLTLQTKSLERLNAIINGTDKELAGMKSFQGLEYFFDHDSSQDIALTKKAGDQAAAIHVSADDAKQLDAENEALWGKIKHDKTSLRFEKQGYFSAVLLQLRAEQKRVNDQVTEYTSKHKKMVDLLEKCKSENTVDYPVKAKARGAGDPTITGAIEKPKTPDSSGASQGPGGGPLDRTQKVLHPKDSNADADAAAAAAAADPDAAAAARQPVVPAANTPPAEIPPPTPVPRQPSAAGTFLKDNWMWLAGGAALVGGGVFLYKKYKDDKAKKAYWQDDSHFLPTATAVSNSTTTTPGTPAAGSKFTFVSSVTGPGGIGQSMGPISVTVTDPSNVIQNVSGTAILSCATPSPCSIGGATTATITSGQATFSGVTFSSADQNVMLQVSGAGIANSTAPSTFNVGGSTATNPRY
jgi:hypothetical protein